MARIISFYSSDVDNQKLIAIGYHVGETIPESEVIAVAGKIYTQTNLNVMLVHNGTENTTICVNESFFKQR